MNDNPTILSYEESLLRKSDVDLLDGPYWLNDSIISFYFEYLKKSIAETASILFIGPEVTQCLKLIPDSQLKVFLDPIHARSSHFIFFALSDSDCPRYYSGSHWSLLVFSLLDETIHHYDSSSGYNTDQAKVLAGRLFNYFNIKGEFIQEPCLLQTNGYDCGIHLIFNAEFLTKHLLRDGLLESCDLTNDELYQGINNMRQQIKNVIYTLKGQGC